MDNNNYFEQSIRKVDDTIDIIALTKTLWDGRKKILWITIVFLILGVVISMVSPKEYETSTVLVPQVNNRTGSLGRYSGLAAMAGVNLSSVGGSIADLSPTVYPQLLKSKQFQKELIYIPLKWTEFNRDMTLVEYVRDYQKTSPLQVVKKYTIGLPYLILKTIRKLKIDENESKNIESLFSYAGVVTLSGYERKAIALLLDNLSLQVDQKEGTVKLTASATNPQIAAQLARQAQMLLQSSITEFKIEKAKQNLNFIEARFKEREKEFIQAQKALATYRDRNINRATALAQTEEERLTSEYQIALSVFTELATQLEDAKIKVTEDTPVFSIIQPIVLPNSPIKPNFVRIVFILGILGFTIGVTYILLMRHYSQLKTRWNNYQ